MLQLFLVLCASLDDICTTLYKDSGCPICISHYADRQCGWCSDLGDCVSLENHKCQSYLYGPEARCDGAPVPIPPTPTSVPTPAPFNHSECHLYDSDCETCTKHWNDRHCGFCAEEGKQGCFHFEDSTCSPQHFYFNGNAKCYAVIPTPKPSPIPPFDRIPDFCAKMTGDWCTKCVSTNKSMHCGWCHTTKECIMGDANGPFFLGCEEWSFEEDDKCKGMISKSAALGLRIGIGLFVGSVVVICVVGCYRVIRKRREPEVAQINN